jgi:hypothetical protein
MGTNYYLRLHACPSCGHSAAELHIGKSSAGWYFGLRVYPLRIVSREPKTFIFGVPVQINPTDETVSDERLVPFGVNNISELDDWRPLFERFPIFDEYDKPVTAKDMLATITERSHPRGLLSRLTAGPEHMGPFWKSGRDDQKAGLGTYDLCNYEFS